MSLSAAAALAACGDPASPGEGVATAAGAGIGANLASDSSTGVRFRESFPLVQTETARELDRGTALDAGLNTSEDTMMSQHLGLWT